MGNWLQITAWPRQGSLMLQVPDCVVSDSSVAREISKAEFSSWEGRANGEARMVRGRRAAERTENFILICRP